MRWIVVSAVMLGVLSCGRGVVAYDYAVQIDVSPPSPTESTPVSINAWTWFPDTGQEFVSASYVRDGFEIEMDVVMQDTQSAWLVVVQDGGTVDCGFLSAGLYNVTAQMWMIPWESNVPEPFRSGSTSFRVTPEPSTLILLTVGSLAILASSWRRRDRS